jgi:hypothetical protein
MINLYSGEWRGPEWGGSWHRRGKSEGKGGDWDALSGLRILLGMVSPRRCRGLTREMHLRCARIGGAEGGPVKGEGAFTAQPWDGVAGGARAVGTRAPTGMRPNGARISQPMATPWEPAPPRGYAPTGHASRFSRQRLGKTASFLWGSPAGLSVKRQSQTLGVSASWAILVKV